MLSIVVIQVTMLIMAILLGVSSMGATRKDIGDREAILSILFSTAVVILGIVGKCGGWQ